MFNKSLNSIGSRMPVRALLLLLLYFTVCPVLPLRAEGGASASHSTLTVCPPVVWANGSNTAAVTVYLFDTNGTPVAGDSVSLSASGSALPLIITPNSATSGLDGVAIFMAAATNAGTAVFTATAGTNNVAIAQTGGVTFVTPPPDLSVYIPDSTVLQTWDTGTGWADWSMERTRSIDACGNVVLGKADEPGSQEGWMYIDAPAGLSYEDSGVEVTFNLAPKGIDIHTTHTLLQMLTWDNAFGLGLPRQGFDVWTGANVSSGNTRQMFRDGNYASDPWDTTPATLPGLHTLAMLRYADGMLETYFDGVLVNSQQTTDPAVSQLQWLGVGYQVSGSWYITRGTIVERVRAFIYDPDLGPVDPDLSSVVAAHERVWADGIAAASITVTLRDANGNRIPDKDVTLAAVGGPGGATISPASATSGAKGKATFTVASTNIGVFTFSATVTTDDPDVALNQTPVVNYVPIDFVAIQVNLDVTARAGLEGPTNVPGTVWNQHLGLAALTANGLLDATGAVSSVGFSCDASHVFGWGVPPLTVLASAAFRWGANDAYTLTINGVPFGRKYDLFLVSFHPNEDGGKALFSTANTTDTTSPQTVDNGGAGGNASTWVEGVNYANFINIEANESGDIITTIDGDDTGGNRRRAYLSGFQLVEHVDPILPPPTGVFLILR
jgi:hypothetical protein